MLKSSVAVANFILSDLTNIANNLSEIDMVRYASNTDVEVQNKCNHCYTKTRNLTVSFASVVKEEAQHILDTANEFESIDLKWRGEMEKNG